jgi:tetratricopeptide (TPR) repeat protein
MQSKMKRIMMMLVFVAAGFGAFAQDAAVKEGIKLYNYKKYKSAQTKLTPLAEKDALANYYLGLSYLETGNIAQAGATFSKFPEDLANISGTARVAFAKKDIAGGNKITKDLAAKAKRKDWEPQKYAADAITYSEGGDYNQAAAWYKDVLSKGQGDNAEVHIGLGDVMRKIPGGGGEAMTNYEMVTEKDKTNSLAYSRIGDLWYEARNYQSALDNYARAKDADNTNPLPYKALSDAYSRSGKYAQALQNLEEYLSHSDNTPEDQLEYVRALYQAQSYCDAAKLSQKLLGGQTDKARVVELTGILGFSQANCGDSVAAVGNLRKYFQMQDPKKVLPGAYMEFGKLFIKLNMLDSAGFYYMKGVSSDTSRMASDQYHDMIEAYKNKKEYCKTVEWYEKIIKSNPNAAPVDYFWKGYYTFYYCSDLAGAVQAFSDYETKYPAQPSAIYWHARALAAIDSEATEGTAAPYFKRWLDTVGANYDKKNDMKIAYQYLLLHNFKKQDKEEMKVYMKKMEEIDPNDGLLKQIIEAEKAGTVPKKTGAAAGKK